MNNEHVYLLLIDIDTPEINAINDEGLSKDKRTYTNPSNGNHVESYLIRSKLLDCSPILKRDGKRFSSFYPLPLEMEISKDGKPPNK